MPGPNNKRKVPKGPKVAVGKGKLPSAVKKAKPAGTSASGASYGIANTSRKHSSAVSQPSGRNLPSGQGLLSGKAKRQVG